MTEIADDAMSLTARQQEIIDLYSNGLSLREVGSFLGISPQRVHEVMRRFGPELMRSPNDRYARSKKNET